MADGVKSKGVIEGRRWEAADFFFEIGRNPLKSPDSKK